MSAKRKAVISYRSTYTRGGIPLGSTRLRQCGVRIVRVPYASGTVRGRRSLASSQRMPLLIFSGPSFATTCADMVVADAFTDTLDIIGITIWVASGLPLALPSDYGLISFNT